MKFSLIGIDLAKNVFQVCALDQHGNVKINRSVSRVKLAEFLAQTDATDVAMEACGSAHFWARQAMAHRHTVRLLPAQHVKPFLRGNKTDRQDALAICEAARRPGIHSVPVKTLAQQDIQLLCRYRSRVVAQRTATCNQIRSFAAEYGVIFSQGVTALLSQLPEKLEADNPLLTAVARQVLHELYLEVRRLQLEIDRLRQQLHELASQQEAFKRLVEVPGFGPMVSAAFLGAVGNGHQFQNGRQVAAWLGLVPRQHGTGGKIKLMGITKRGDRSLRALLVHGARAVMRWANQRDDALGCWLRQLRERRGHNKTVVALANKMARIAWSIVAREERFDMSKAFSY